MAFVLPLIPLGIGAFKVYQNFLQDARQANSDEMRKRGMVERLSIGSNLWIAALNEEQFVKFLKTNSVGKCFEPELWAARANLRGNDQG